MIAVSTRLSTATDNYSELSGLPPGMYINDIELTYRDKAIK